MERLGIGSFRPPVYSGELYLELHRGTLTNQHQIKQNNRQAEIALLIAEDVPAAWNNWDVDADIADKWRDNAVFPGWRVISQ